MTNDLKQKEDIVRAMLDPNFLLKTKHQIIKDFAKVDLTFQSEFEFEIDDKEEIERLIANEVASIMERGERHLLQLLYAIDFSEQKFLRLTTQVDFLPKLSEQILLREAYKVWLRIHYSSK